MNTTTPTNAHRAKWAQLAVNAFIDEVGGDFADAVSDLICDLCHLADQEGMDTLEEVRRALGSYADERDYPPDGWAPSNAMARVDITITRGPMQSSEREAK